MGISFSSITYSGNIKYTLPNLCTYMFFPAVRKFPDQLSNWNKNYQYQILRSMYGQLENMQVQPVNNIDSKLIPPKYLHYTSKTTTQPTFLYYLHQFYPANGQDKNSIVNKYPVYSVNSVPSGIYHVPNIQVQYILPPTMQDYKQTVLKLGNTQPHLLQSVPVQPVLPLQTKNTHLNLNVKPMSVPLETGNRKEGLSNGRETHLLSAQLKPTTPLLVAPLLPAHPLHSTPPTPLFGVPVTSPIFPSTKPKPSSTLSSMRSSELKASVNALVEYAKLILYQLNESHSYLSSSPLI